MFFGPTENQVNPVASGEIAVEVDLLPDPTVAEGKILLIFFFG